MTAAVHLRASGGRSSQHPDDAECKTELSTQASARADQGRPGQLGDPSSNVSLVDFLSRAIDLIHSLPSPRSRFKIYSFLGETVIGQG